MAGTTCCIDGCDRQGISRGWCESHYRRWLHHGDPQGGRPTRVLSTSELAARLADHGGRIHNPRALATRYLANRRLLGKTDQDELVAVAIEAIVDAVLAWEPLGGRSILSWAYLYMDRNVNRFLQRRQREYAELGAERCVSDEDWRYDAGTDWYHRIEVRVDLQRWADLAELTPYQRWLVEWGAQHHGVYVRDTPLAGSPSPLKRGASSYRVALGHMRNAALTGRRRDDRWTRARRATEVAS